MSPRKRRAVEDNFDLLKKASQPIRAFTNASGVIATYMKIVEQVIKEKAAAATGKKSA